MVLKSQIDFALVEGPIHSKDIISKAFMDDELILICGKDHSFRNKKNVTLKELAQEDLILRERGSGTRELFENIMLANEQNLIVKWVCNNSETIKNAVRSNIGISIISKMAVVEELKNKELFHIKIDNIKFKRKFNIIYHKNKFVSDLIRNFWDMVID